MAVAVVVRAREMRGVSSRILRGFGDKLELEGLDRPSRSCSLGVQIVEV